MDGVDLIPSPRRELHMRRRRVRAWVGAGSAYAVLLGGTLAGAAAAWPRDQETPAATLASLATENEGHRRQFTLLSQEISQKQRELAANRAVGNQPDWSVLLALLAEALGPEAALREVELTQETVAPPAAPAQTGKGADKKAASQPPPEPVRYFSLRLGGIARSQVAVNGVVRRLEATGLFELIELLETRREGSGANDLTAFRVRGKLGARKEER